MQSLMNKCVQNGSSNGGPDPAVESVFEGDLMLDLKGHLKVFFKSN